MKVLIVYALTGLGHLREATSVKHGLDKAGIENEMLDMLAWAKKYSWYTRMAILPLRFGLWLHALTTRNVSLYNELEFQGSMKRIVLYLLRLIEVPIGLALKRHLRKSDIDVVVAVHPWGVGSIWTLGLGPKLKQLLINVVVDEIDQASASFYAVPDVIKGPWHFVNSDAVKRLMINIGVAPEKIKIVGHTLDPYVLDKRDAIKKRVNDHLRNSKTLTLGMFIGGVGTKDEKERIKNVFYTLREQILAGLYNIKVIPGPHFQFAVELHKYLVQLGLAHQKNIEVYVNSNRHKVVATGHEWLVNDIDVLFAKTGELIFYVLGTGIPFIHFPPKGANEVQHIILMKKFSAIEEFDRIDNLHEFLQNRKYLIELGDNAFNSNYKLDGAEEIAKFIKNYYFNQYKYITPIEGRESNLKFRT